VHGKVGRGKVKGGNMKRVNRLEDFEISMDFGGPKKQVSWKCFWEAEDMDKPVWFLEWSPDQKCFHVDSLNAILNSNRWIAKNKSPGKAPGYIIIAGPMLHDEAFYAIREFEKVLGITG
jgi:hypothetical protein